MLLCLPQQVQRSFDVVRQRILPRRKSGFRSLQDYLRSVGEPQDLDTMIAQTFSWLRDSLGVRYAAFALYDREFNGGIDIWLSTRHEEMRTAHYIMADFNLGVDQCNIRLCGHENRVEGQIPLQSLHTVPVLDTRTRARLYIIPAARLRRRERELLSLVAGMLAGSVSTHITVKELQNAAMIDPLVQCYNRRAFEELMEHDIASATRYRRPLSVVMFDIDHFKCINDTHGHKAGDAVLRALARAVQHTIRKSDYLTRYGGEEFVLVMPATSFARAIEIAERVRRVVEALHVPVDGAAITLTASFGVAMYKSGLSTTEFLHRADQMLYAAKQNGRNCIRPELRVMQASHMEQYSSEPLMH